MEEMFKKKPYYVADSQKQYLKDVDFSKDEVSEFDKKIKRPVVLCEGDTEKLYLGYVLDAKKCKCEKAKTSNVKKIFEQIDKMMTEDPMLQIYAVCDHDPCSNTVAQLEVANKVLADFPDNVFRVFSKPSFEMVFLCAFLSQQEALILEFKEDLAEKYKPTKDYHAFFGKNCNDNCDRKKNTSSLVDQHLNKYMETKYGLEESAHYCVNWKPFNRCVKRIGRIANDCGEEISYLDYYIKTYFVQLNFTAICKKARDIYPKSLINNKCADEWYNIANHYTEIFYLEDFAITTLQ